MERDLDVVPGLKIAGCVTLVIVVVGAAIGFLWYPIAYGFNNITAPFDRLGPVDFFGKVVDEQGNGIPGVTLTASIRSYRVFGGYFDRTTNFETDASGEFRIESRRAISMRVYQFTKPGFAVRGRPAFKGQPVDTLDFWVFYFDPNTPLRSKTEQEEPFVFIMDETSGPNKAASSSPNL